MSSLNEQKYEAEERNEEKEAGPTDLVFSETILFLAWTASGVATVNFYNSMKKNRWQIVLDHCYRLSKARF